MALARSASGPGGLSINTNSANSLFDMQGAEAYPIYCSGSGSTPAPGGMFGNTQASKPLFGAPANTTAPQSGGLFGATTSQPAGGLFGSTATTSQPQTGGLFGSTTPQPSTGGLFGSATSSQPQAGGLFGSATTSQPQAGGLFGSAAASQPQAGGGLFGSAATSQSQPGGLPGSTAPSQTQTGGLFGSNGGGLFGNTTTSQPASSGGLFGQSTVASQPQQSGGLFGGLGLGSQPAQNQNQNQTQNQNQNTGGGLFGGSSANQGSSLFGGAQSQNKPAATSLFGGLGSSQNQQSQSQKSTMSQQPLGGGFLSSNQQQQFAPGVRIDMANIKGSTRVQELHEDLQKQLAFMDGIILAQEERMTVCQAFMPPHGQKIDNVPSDVEYCTRKMRALADLMDGDVEAVSGLKLLVEEDAEHAKLSFRAIDNLKLPPQYHNPGWPTKATSGDNRSQGNSSAADSQDIVGYFSATADDLNSKLAKYQKNISEIETHLRGVEVSTAQQIQTFVSRKQGGGAAQSDEIRELAESFQDFERGILNVAGKVGSAREKVQSLQLGGFMGANSGATKTRRTNGVY
ncbi:Nuclear pore NUP49 [Hyphodiscus hymeniophilus]|uniref:Nuclear pore NUP49 n=1 Tax=Hyphodiscus hymeniophilus TaxID=353542 RepID=A0A9P6VQR7_9HELO|nr:Nuclear pore NUP49 [Hyphodiscus hymeniophilus]